LEDIAGREIEQTLEGAQGLESQRGWTIFRYPGSPEHLLDLRTTEDVFAILFRTTSLPPNRKAALPLLLRMANGSRYWDQAWSSFHRTHRSVKRVTFRVVAQMSGKQGFRRQEVRDAVISGVQARWPHWKAVAEDAHIEIWVAVVNTWATIAIRLSDRTMRHRTYKQEHRPASLRPTMAAAMVALSEPRSNDRFCDPMCGTGTILAERAQMGPYRDILGGEFDAPTLAAAQANLASVGELRNQPVLQLWNACALPIRHQSLTAVVSNLPFGKQIGSPESNPALYARFFDELKRVLAPGGRAVLLTSEKDLMRELIHRHAEIALDRQVLVGLLGQSARIYVLRRTYDSP
jgi:23S rRNA G2445 N2-methylase RlmL